MAGFLVSNAWLIPCLPLVGAVIAAVGGRWLKERASLPVIIGIGLAFLVSLGPLFNADPERTAVAFDWFKTGNLSVPIEFRVDGLTTMMLSMVTFVSTLVAIFAAGYMAGDPGYPRFFALVGLFVFSMTGLVLSGNYLLTYAFWEGVGVCSYLLVGFWYAKPEAAAAAKKAFLVNRIGDVGFAIAIFMMWNGSPGHDLSYENVLSANNLSQLPFISIYTISLLLFWAATAKSAQIPLYVWLPDAMEGPTPVSALIHAATMVTAGVYLIARSMPLLVLAPDIQVAVCAVGCMTALLAASIALTQTDLKRVMAYSTVSQLGYMFMGLGAGVGSVARLAIYAGMFHLFTHAFFKALLFLSSGSVMHAMGGVIDMRRFRGLRKRLPHTHATFAIGALTLSGIFPLAGFFSKDEILIAIREASHVSQGSESGIYWVIYWVAVITAFMTAFYAGRAYFLTFWGPEKLPSPADPEAVPTPQDPHSTSADHTHSDDTGHGHDSHFGHESSLVMIVPLYILAACAVLAGMVFGWSGLFEHHLEKTFGFERLAEGSGQVSAGLTPWLGSLVGLLGIGLSYVLYAAPSLVPGRIATRLGRLYTASLNKFYVDEFYSVTVVRPTLIAARVAAFLDEYVIDGLVGLVAWIPRITAREVLGPFQNGLIQFYAAATALGVAALLWILLFN